MKWISNLLWYWVAIMGGALMAFAHPFRVNDFAIDGSYFTFFMASAGLCAYLLAVHRSEAPWHRFFRALLGGVAFFSISHFWLVSALTNFGGLPLWIAVLAAGFVAFHSSFFLGVWGFISGLKVIREKSVIIRMFAWASLWVALEAYRQWLSTAFHWGELGYHFHHSSFLFNSAHIWGAHGLTFWWIFFAAAIVFIREWATDRRLSQFVFGWLLFFILIVFVGNLRVWSLQSSGQIKVGLIQPNVSQEEKWDPEKLTDNINALLELTQKAADEGPNVILWPETAYPRLVTSSQKKLPFTSEVPLVVGAVVRDGRVNRNSALMMKGDEILGRFDKENLVPFGEYVPYKDILPFGKLVQAAGDFEPGKDQDPLVVPDLGTKLGPLICYEDTFNRAAVDRVRKGAQLLINITNDAWYGKSSAQAQHTAMAAFQVYQTLTPMVRATNDGLTSVITPFQRLDLPQYTQNVSVHEVPLYSSAQTFYVWTYPLMEWIWIIIFVIALGWTKSRQTKRIFFRN